MNTHESLYTPKSNEEMTLEQRLTEDVLHEAVIAVEVLADFIDKKLTIEDLKGVVIGLASAIMKLETVRKVR
jgi:hypothetical protein